MSVWFNLWRPEVKNDQAERPAISRWLGRVRILEFNDEHWVSIPDATLEEHPQFHALWKDNQTLQMCGIPYHVAHIVVHYLHTKGYQELKVQQSTEAERNSVDFTTAVYVHGVALKYKLHGLRQLAAEHLQLYGDKLTFIQLIKKLSNPPFEGMAINGALLDYVCYRTNDEGTLMSIKSIKEVQSVIGGTMSGILCQKITSLEAEKKELQQALSRKQL